MKGFGVWNDWRKAHPEIVPDLSGSDMGGLDVSGFDFTEADLTNSTFNTSLENAITEGAKTNGMEVTTSGFGGLGAKKSPSGPQHISASGRPRADSAPQGGFGGGGGFGGSGIGSGGFGGGGGGFLTASDAANQYATKSQLDATDKEVRRYVDEQVIGFGAHLDMNLKNELDQLWEELNPLLEPVKKSKAELDEIIMRQHEVSQAVKNVELSLPRLGVGAHAATFEELVAKHAKASYMWFCATVTLTCLTFLVAILDYLHTQGFLFPSQQVDVPSSIASRVIIFSLLSFATLWASKNYRSQKHNEATNQHRATALRTYASIFKGAHSPDIEDKLLVIAADAMFRDRPTGYDGYDTDSKSTNPVIAGFVNVIEKVAKPDKTS